MTDALTIILVCQSVSFRIIRLYRPSIRFDVSEPYHWIRIRTFLLQMAIPCRRLKARQSSGHSTEKKLLQLQHFESENSQTVIAMQNLLIGNWLLGLLVGGKKKLKVQSGAITRHGFEILFRGIMIW